MRSSFKILLRNQTDFDIAVKSTATIYIASAICELPRRRALVRELSEATDMEQSRTRRLLNDLGIPSSWADYEKKGE